MPGKYSQASTVAPTEELNYTRRDRVKGVLVNTPTPTSVVSPIKRDAVLIFKLKIENGLRKKY
jgi:hypothetical protein